MRVPLSDGRGLRRAQHLHDGRVPSRPRPAATEKTGRRVRERRVFSFSHGDSEGKKKKQKSAKKTKVTASRKPAKKAAPARKAAKKAKAAPARRPAKKAKAARKPAKKAKVARAARPPAKPSVARPKTLQRRDHAGHIDPTYAAELLDKSEPREPDPQSFVEQPRSSDDLVEELGEEFVQEVTGAEYKAEDTLNEEVAEEVGGPFVTTGADTEFAQGTDPSNPPDATREPFPRS